MIKMSDYKNKILSLTRETLEDDARRWLNIIRYNESGTIIALQNDAIYRVNQLINDKKLIKKILGKYYKKYILDYLSLNDDNLLNLLENKLKSMIKGANIEEMIKNIEKKGYDIGFFIDYGGNIIEKKSEHKQLFYLETLLRKHKNFSVIMFSEKNILYPKYNKLVNQCSSLFTHIIKYPLYSDEDSYQFIAYNEYLWKIKFPEKIKKEIIKNCGGYLWLIRQALRLIRDEENVSLEKVFNHELMIKKLEVIWNKLTSEEKKVLKNVFYKNITEEIVNSNEYQYLKSINMIKNNSLGIPILKNVLEKEKQLDKLYIKNNSIYLNDKNISLDLTKNEFRIIWLLIENKNQLISREKIAENIWGENWQEQYSDWAIDRLIYRIRKKLKLFGYNEKFIKTLKSKGIILG